MFVSIRKPKVLVRKRKVSFIEMLERRQLLTAVAFEVDSALSQISISGDIQTAGGDLVLAPQATGSLTTAYSGTINADVEANSIQFNNTSSVVAANNGTWNPGAAPGNYGATVTTPQGTVPLAIRQLIASGSSAALPIAGNGTFSSTAESLSISAGEIDYVLQAPATDSLVDLTATNASSTSSSYIVSNGQATLTIAFDVTYTTTVFALNDTTLTLTGQVVATAAAPVSSTSISGNIHGAGPLQGVTVYADANNNGLPDASETKTATDASGNYTLSGLKAGSYIVRQILPASFKQISPGNGFGNHLTIAAGQTLNNANFVDTTGPASVSGTVSGTILGPAAAGLSNVIVYADVNNNGKLDANEVKTSTDINGGYVLSSLPAGAYIVRQILPAGYNQVLPTKGFGIHTTLIAGHSITNANFNDTLIGASGGSISGTIFTDNNGNGKIDSGEVGLSFWELYIDQNNSHVMLPTDPTTMTDTNGNFTFSGLAAGTYLIRTALQPAWVQTLPGQNFGQHVTLFNGQSIANILFGEISDG
jgi:uncharacterized protein (DUF2141 family)